MISHTKIHIQTIESYFNAFNNKNTKVIRSLLSSDVILKDWIVNIKGIDDVTNMFNEIFSKNESLKIRLLNLTTSNYCIAAEIVIEINNKEIIEVVDVFKFKDDKISSEEELAANKAMV